VDDVGRHSYVGFEKSETPNIGVIYPIVCPYMPGETSYSSFMSTRMDENIQTIAVIDNGLISGYPADTTLDKVRTSLDATAGILVNVRSKKEYREETPLPAGLYRLIRPYKTIITTNHTYKTFDKNSRTLPKMIKPSGKVWNRPEADNWTPEELTHTELSPEAVQSGLLSYINKPTPGSYLSMHFFHRARFLQMKNSSIGSVTDRLRNGLCVITGVPVQPGVIMSTNCYDKILQNLCEGLKEKNEWEPLLEKKDQEFDPDDEPLVPEPPIVTSGETNYSITDKFAYIDPKRMIQEFCKLAEKKANLKRFIENLLT